VSEPVLPSSPVFDDPTSVPFVPEGTNPGQVDAATAPVAVGGVGQTWTTTAAAEGQVNQVVVTGENTRLNLGTGAGDVNATGAGGAIIESVQLVDSSGNPIPDASKTIAVGGDNYNGASISLTEQVSGNSTSQQETIQEAAGGALPGTGTPVGGFAYYVHGGTGDDVIRGSSFNDFLRGGAGNDFINAGAGEDLVRGGTGSDTLFLGQGLDTLYYTDDQVGGGDIDILQDFTSGEDRVNVAKGISATISGDGKSILFTNQATGGVTRLDSLQDQFKLGDINFLA
jgi:Ca2+-binding RTX toxin-like protein